jgi:hypothetical protein
MTDTHKIVYRAAFADAEGTHKEMHFMINYNPADYDGLAREAAIWHCCHTVVPILKNEDNLDLVAPRTIQVVSEAPLSDVALG